MGSWGHQTLSWWGGNSNSKTCQAEGREGACFLISGGLRSWERNQTDEHWEEECLPSLSSGASAAKSSAGLRLLLERLPLGLEGWGRPSPQASRPSAQLVWGPPPPPVPWELEGGCEGISQAPPPRPAATEPSGSNIPSPLKGEVAASKLRQSKALQLSEEKTPPGSGDEERQETLPALPPRL